MPRRRRRSYGYQPTRQEIQANKKGEAATRAAQQKKQELMAQGMSEAEAHQQASQLWQQQTSGGSPGESSNYLGMADEPSGWQNPSGWQDEPLGSGPSGGPPPMTGPSYRSTNNPRDAAQNQRDMIQWRGDQLNQQGEDDYWRAAGRARGYDDMIDPYANEMAQGRGGYNDDERARIYQDGREGENFLTDDERQASEGDPDSWGDYFNPEGLEGAQRDSAGLQRGAAQRLNDRVSQAVNPDQLRQSGGYRDRSRQALADNRANTWNTIEGNATNVRGAIDTTGQNVRGSIDPDAVTTSREFLDDYNMSAQEKQDMVESAGISAGTGYRAATGEAQRRALAAGASPMGVAAYRARMERASAGDAADAMTKARVATDAEDARRKMSGEELRTQGGRYLTDTRVGSEMELGRMRSDAEQRMGAQAIDTQRRLGENETAQINAEEDNRLNAEQYLTDAQMKAAQIGSGAELNTEGNINNQQRQTGQFNATLGSDIARGRDTARSDRAYRGATNRQGVSLTNQERASGRGATVGNARLNQQQFGMNTLQQQGQMQNQNAQNARQRQQQTFGIQSGGGNAAAGNQVQQQAVQAGIPGRFDKIMGGIGGALSGASKAMADGGVVTEPTLALLGEDGPEAVVPAYRAQPKTRPQPDVQSSRRPFYGERRVA